MTDKVSKWRKSRLHRRCNFCKYCVHRGGVDFGHYFCTSKEIVISETDAHQIPRPFCALFELKPSKEDSK